MPFRMQQVRLDKSAGPFRRALQYAYYDWTREMPRSKRIITWAGILIQVCFAITRNGPFRSLRHSS
jgi:hypothetical protein